MPLAAMSNAGLHLGVVILAAGNSTRMRQPKLLLPWDGTSVLGHLHRTWASLEAAQIAVVCAADAGELHAELDRLPVVAPSRIINLSPEKGIISSIQCAARWPAWQPGLSHFVIVLGDQPHLRRTTLEQLLRFAAAKPQYICQPLRGGRRRHPAILTSCVFAELRSTEAISLRCFLDSKPGSLAGLELAEPGLDLDLDSTADYERAKAITDSH
jgi:molybdenum cofactor cytidylyltransferase